MSVPSPVLYQLLRLIKWRISGVIKGPNGPRESKMGKNGLTRENRGNDS